MRRSPLKRRTELRRTAPKKRAKAISPASPAQKAKVHQIGFCIVTGFQPDEESHALDPAHLCPRSHGGCDSDLCVVPLVRTIHRQFDDGKFDLLPYLRPFGAERRWLPEILHALEHYEGDMIGLLQRLTGQRWTGQRWRAE